jgi:hypothetical protein
MNSEIVIIKLVIEIVLTFLSKTYDIFNFLVEFHFHFIYSIGVED